VVVGQLAGSTSDSITNQAEELAATVAQVLLDGAAHDSVIWVLAYPDGLFGSSRGNTQVVRFRAPFADPTWEFIDHEQLEALAGGPVKRWHTNDYTIARRTAAWVRVLTPDNRRHHP
jgi:hypothetical protein